MTGTKTIDYQAVIARAKQRLETQDSVSFVIVHREEMTLAELVTAEVGADQWQEAMRAFHRRSMH